MKHRHHRWLTQFLYLTPLTWVAIAGCQVLATSSFVVLAPPALIDPRESGGCSESAPNLGPGTRVPTPSRLAQPTLSAATGEKPVSAAPGLSDARQAAHARTLLLKATASIEEKDFSTAARHLEQYLLSYPDSALIRLQLAELRFRDDRFDDARKHFQQALAEVVDPELPVHCKLHAHSRLMEIAGQLHDRFNEELQRGIGLLVLAEHRQTQSSTASEVSSQELLGKARTALTRAAMMVPGDARPSLYLAAVWHAMGQHSNALHSLRQSQSLAFKSRLTASEWMQLALWDVEWRRQ